MDAVAVWQSDKAKVTCNIEGKFKISAERHHDRIELTFESDHKVVRVWLDESEATAILECAQGQQFQPCRITRRNSVDFNLSDRTGVTIDSPLERVDFRHIWRDGRVYQTILELGFKACSFIFLDDDAWAVLDALKQALHCQPKDELLRRIQNYIIVAKRASTPDLKLNYTRSHIAEMLKQVAPDLAEKARSVEFAFEADKVLDEIVERLSISRR